MENNQINSLASCRKYYKCILTTIAITTLAASTTYLLFQNKRQKEIVQDHARAINELQAVMNNNRLTVNLNDYLNSVFNDRKFAFNKFFTDIENKMSELRQSFYKDNLNGKVKVVSNEKECIVTAALPGFSKQEILITLFSDNLEISAQHSANEDNKDNKDITDKQSQEKIKYTIAVPVNIDRNNVTAQFENGLLTVKFIRIADHVAIEPKEILID